MTFSNGGVTSKQRRRGRTNKMMDRPEWEEKYISDNIQELTQGFLADAGLLLALDVWCELKSSEAWIEHNKEEK
jgi:hypothetical protein